MSYQLHNDLSFCRVDQCVIFLDVASDRYFRLSNTLEKAFIAHLEYGSEHDYDFRCLIERNILVDGQGSTDHTLLSAAIAPLRSDLEQAASVKKAGIAVSLEVQLIVLLTHMLLKSRPLKQVISFVDMYRRQKTGDLSQSLAASRMHLLSEVAAAYRRARLLVPIDTCCLLDSLSMVIFLARRHFPASIVFGVTGEPFSAHCWVQAGDLVLNDTIGSATAYTPIRVV